MSQLTLQQASTLALKHYQAGRLPESGELCHQILAHDPRQTGALQLLGLIAHRLGHNHVALDWIGQVVALDPSSPNAHYNLGVVLQGAGRLDDAIAAFRQAILLRPDYAAAYNNLGIALHDHGQPDDAIAAFRQAIAFRPHHAQGHTNLADSLKRLGKLDEAIASYQRAVSLDPDYAQAHNNLGNALKLSGRLDDAITAYRTAIQLEPDDAELHSNLGNALTDKGQTEEGIAAHRQAVALQPDSAEFHGNLALTLLLSRRFKDGWREYEWRWRTKDAPQPRQNFQQPAWDGTCLNGRTILIIAEQGFGDAIQFVRYVPPLVEQGAIVVFQSHPELVRLMEHVAGMDPVKIIPRSNVSGSPVPPFDVHASLMSLPLLLDLHEPGAASVKPPYLFFQDDLQATWRHRITASSRPKIGIAWAGSPLHPSDSRRSIPLRTLAPLLQCDVDFYSLQLGDASRQNWDSSRLIDLTSHCADFLDTACLISQLDLVISVDTAVAHLAGAMGKRTWLMVPYTPDWRWQLGCEDSPWYPAVKLFRQLESGEGWDGVVNRVTESLQREFREGNRRFQNAQ
jgi:Flp pilus assembly protein TadD